MLAAAGAPPRGVKEQIALRPHDLLRRGFLDPGVVAGEPLPALLHVGLGFLRVEKEEEGGGWVRRSLVLLGPTTRGR